MDHSEALRHRRDEAARAWAITRGAVLVPSGLMLPVAGTDQFHDFHAHPEHAYLSGASAPAGVLAFDPTDGWTLFANVPGEDDVVWTGAGEPLEETASKTGLERVLPLPELQRWLERRRGEPLAVIGNRDLLTRPGGYGIVSLDHLELDIDEELSASLSQVVAESRRAKVADEIDRMRLAAQATRRGHLAGMRLARPGITERQLQIEIEAEFFREGAERTAYGSLVGSGVNGAVLHFAPSPKPMRGGELVLVDAGAEWQQYASDVTRTYPVGQRFEGIHRDLYALVLHVQREAIAAVRPGVEYRDLHLRASATLAAGLVDLGVLRGHPQDLVDRDVHALFFPHGLGHMLGLATHDSGGCLAGREPSNRFGLKWLRADLPLQPGYVVTIEPGVYFIRALLTDPARRATFADAVRWDRVDTMLDLGGIRIEDDVLVTESGADVLTAAIPKTIADIEAIRREAQA